MAKTFEDYFTELQADMVDICLEYVEDKAEKIYIMCFCEDGEYEGNYFFMVNGKVVDDNDINDVLGPGNEIDTSGDLQGQVLNVFIEDILEMERVCKEFKRPMPTLTKMVYDATKNSLQADYKYGIILGNQTSIDVMDIFEEWFEEEKKKHNKN